MEVYGNGEEVVVEGTVIGREREMAELQQSLESDRSEFVIVYGRRRVGKTYLVDNFLIMSMNFHLLKDIGSPSRNN